jgi:hypothetical protein
LSFKRSESSHNDAVSAVTAGLGPKNQTQYNIKLPSTKTNGAVLNIIADDMLANVSSESLSAPKPCWLIKWP